MESRVTRRQLAAALVGGTALLAQKTEEELKAARDQCRQFGEQLGKFPILMSTEPAFQFKA